jgi:hypothetical protein
MEEDITPQMEREFFKVLKDSRLFLPVVFSENMFEGIEDAEVGDVLETSEPTGFSIQFLTDTDGNRVVPLFTSEKMMQTAGIVSSVYVIYMSDLAGMLEQTDKYSSIAINPFSQHDLNIPMEAFLSRFTDEDKLGIADIRNDRLKELLSKKDLSEDELTEFGERILSSIMITGCVDNDDGTSFVLIWNNEDEPHLALFTDIDEFKKIFDDYREDVYPAAYHFIDVAKVAKENMVINPASQSLVLNPEIFKE